MLSTVLNFFCKFLSIAPKGLNIRPKYVSIQWNWDNLNIVQWLLVFDTQHFPVYRLLNSQLETDTKTIQQMYFHYFSKLKYIIFPTWLYKRFAFFLQVSSYFYKYECCQYQFSLSLCMQVGANQVPWCTNHFRILGTGNYALKVCLYKKCSNIWRNREKK